MAASARAMEVAAAWQEVQTGAHQRNGSENRQEDRGGELPKETHFGRY
jgi:hypothetical protein